jgi:hypothetical protein
VPDLQGEDSRPREYAKASVEGVYDVLRGGHRNLRVDEAVADPLEHAFPGTGAQMIEERAFTMRAVAWAADHGTRQFIVADAGMPAPAGLNVHERAQAARPGSVTAYASAHPYAAVWTRALLAEGDPLVASIEASVSDPDQVFGDPGVTGLIDFGEPVCVVASMVLHFAAPPLARRMLRGLADPLAAGSSVVVSAWTSCKQEQGAEFGRLFAIRPIHRHSEVGIARWMTDAGLRIEPKPRDRHSGVVDARLWPHQAWAAGQLPGRPAERIVVAVGERE